MSVVALGLIPFYKTCANTGGWLEPASFTRASGMVPACWEHWQFDDCVFHRKASYLIGRDGMLVIHELDESEPAERRIIQAIRAGVELGFSYGGSSTPDAARVAVAAWAKHRATGRLVYAGQAEPASTPRHMSYTESPAIEQQPITLLG